jgi:hypothetical protein
MAQSGAPAPRSPTRMASSIHPVSEAQTATCPDAGIEAQFGARCVGKDELPCEIDHLAADKLIAALGAGPQAGKPPTALNPQVLPGLR